MVSETFSTETSLLRHFCLCDFSRCFHSPKIFSLSFQQNTVILDHLSLLARIPLSRPGLLFHTQPADSGSHFLCLAGPSLTCICLFLLPKDNFLFCCSLNIPSAHLSCLLSAFLTPGFLNYQIFLSALKSHYSCIRTLSPAAITKNVCLFLGPLYKLIQQKQGHFDAY